ncbi:MAG TPA: hypothetical protein DCQ06_01630 [Myxococcales bacterium]|nr:hypothetical protein [Myxococcales bacterium]
MDISSAKQWALLDIAAERVIDALQCAGVQVVVLKGFALVGTTYQAAERPMQDVDLLVDDPERAMQILREQGAEPVPAQDRPLAPSTRSAWGWISREGAHIDLHRAVGAPLRWRPDVPGIFERATKHKVGEITTYRPCNEDLILTIALDLAKDDFCGKPKAATDLQRIVARLDVDWQIVIQRSDQWRCKIALWCALQWADIMYPDEVQTALRPSLLRRTLLQRSVLSSPRDESPRLERQLRAGLVLSDDSWRFVAAGARFIVLRSADWMLVTMKSSK